MKRPHPIHPVYSPFTGSSSGLRQLVLCLVAPLLLRRPPSPRSPDRFPIVTVTTLSEARLSADGNSSATASSDSDFENRPLLQAATKTPIAITVTAAISPRVSPVVILFPITITGANILI